MLESVQLQEPCAGLLPLPPGLELHRTRVLELLRPSYRQSCRETDLSDDGANIEERKTERERDRDIKERNRDQEKLTGIQARTGRDRRADLETD